MARKVFSQRLAKAYWLDDRPAPTKEGFPTFTHREARLIKERNMSTDEILWLYNMKLEDWQYDAFPEEKAPIDPELPRDPRAKALADYYVWEIKKKFFPVADKGNK